jgi:hypothetical protein
MKDERINSGMGGVGFTLAFIPFDIHCSFSIDGQNGHEISLVHHTKIASCCL